MVSPKWSVISAPRLGKQLRPFETICTLPPLLSWREEVNGTACHTSCPIMLVRHIASICRVAAHAPTFILEPCKPTFVAQSDALDCQVGVVQPFLKRLQLAQGPEDVWCGNSAPEELRRFRGEECMQRPSCSSASIITRRPGRPGHCKRAGITGIVCAINVGRDEARP